MESTHAPNPEAIQVELERILKSTPFANANRSQRFLRYVVECSLNNRDEFLKEFSIAMDVFGRNASYDPSINATVRVEAGRLRSRLRDYYAREGVNDPLVIDIPKGGYRATFTEREGVPDTAVPEVAASKPKSSQSAATEIAVHAEKQRWPNWVPLTIAATLFAAVFASVFLWKKPTPPVVTTANGQKVLAVLPFSNQTGSGTNDYLTYGITETLIRQFSQIPGLRVISRAAADRVNKQNAAGEFGVGYLLTGALERDANGRLVLNAELSDAKNGTVLRSKQYIPEEADLRPIQAEIVQDALKGLGISNDAAQAAGAQKPLTSSPTAFQSFLRGEAAARQHDNPANLREAIHDFEEAVRLDPSFAFAYSSMAEGHLALGIFYEPPRDHMPLARQYAHRALTLDPSMHQAHGTLGLINLLYDWNLSSAQSELEEADSRDNAIWQLGCTAHLLSINGRYRHAEEDLESMLEFDPHSGMLLAELGCVRYYAGHYDDSIRDYQRALSLDPHSVLGYWGMGRSLAREGRYKEALENLKQVKKSNGFEPSIITAEIGFTDASSGDRQAAMEKLNQLKEEAKHAYVDPYLMAVVYLGLKDRENTYTWLDRAYQVRSPFLISIATDPKWSDSRGDTRFKALWNRMTANQDKSTAQANALGAL
jgi:TolB-like protein/Flp pilus assembly protein TadD